MKTHLLSMLLLLAAPFFIQAQDPTLSLDQELISSSEMGQPWGMAFINADELLFTEKSGKLFRYNITTDTKTEITGVPSVASAGQGGLLDVALHPDFETNSFVYLSYAKSGNGGNTLGVGRWVLNGNTLTNYTEIFTALPYKSGTGHYGSRIIFDNENHLYFSSSDRQEMENAQLLSNHLGKIIRLNDDGTVPDDNPFVGKTDTMPEIFTYGNRNIQGLVFHSESGKIYAHEHGPRGGDELNLMESGNNYGWPEITYGINYDGSPITEETEKEGMEQPFRYWVPSIAPCGMAIVPLANEEAGEVNFILGALAGTQIQWVKIKDDQHIATYSFMQGYARFRDVEVAPDGSIYALTESPNSLIKLQTNQTVTSSNVLFPETSNNVAFYPNPVQGVVTIVNDNQANSNPEVLVYSGEGKMISKVSSKRITNQNGQMKIDLSHLEAGIYILELKQGNQTKNLRFHKL